MTYLIFEDDTFINHVQHRVNKGCIKTRAKAEDPINSGVMC